MASPYDFSSMANYGLQMPGAAGLPMMGGAQGIQMPGYAPSQYQPQAPQGFGFNMPTAQFGMGMLQSLGGLYGAFQANKLARDQFNFQKGVTETNLGAQLKSYNTALEDRARARAFTEGRDQASADAYVEKNRLTR
ncbi:hypothetical protein RG2014_070 [Delftia phage RG-2014]|uniref:Uncharacterized protein n=1 Tax=Delftia phage RG-2014 TaxID=1563661 RepID=A0A097PAP1_9CAUD|nr:hypothetical protein RG2014_070 [Delftia phage RG-2014]AIU44324.1 hypothetical protein RG2014_070 [Delftia phage RG-2014]